MWRALLIAFATSMFCRAQDHRGIVHVYGSSRITVKLDCGSKSINVNIFLNSSTPFFDWIVVGKTNRHECRQQGNGDLQYLVEIPLLNDPCGTKMIEPSGTFENVISIKKMPLLILEGDETVSVQCVYGPPEVITPIIPTLPASENVQPSFLTSTQPSGQSQSGDDSSSAVETTKTAGILPAHVYLIIFMALFLTLLFLCCGCMFFFFKRRKLRVERRKKLLLAVPANSEMSKLALRHLWWSGKHGLGGAVGGNETVSNDALLTHDYMLTGSSTRGHLSVSTDYPSSTPPSTGGSSNGSRGTVDGQGQAESPGEQEPRAHTGQMYMHNDRRMMAMVHVEPMVAGPGRAATGVMLAANVVSNSLRCIPEERPDYVASDASATYVTRSQGSVQTLVHKNWRPVYAAVEKRGKTSHSGSPSGSPNDQSPSDRNKPNSLNQLRSLTDAYSLALREANEEDDAGSISTLEGRGYSPTREQIREATIVRADVHHVPSPPISAPPPPPDSPPYSNVHAVSSKFMDSNRPPTATNPIATEDPADWEIFIKAVENNPHQSLTDRDIDRWRRLISEDAEIRRLIIDSKSLDDFRAISRSPKYSREFSEQKWAVIVHNLTQVAFMRRLSNIIDNQHEKQHLRGGQSAAKSNGDQAMIVKALDPAQLNSSYNMGETLRDLQNGRQKRLFTREPYHQAKQGVKQMDEEEFSHPKPTDEMDVFVETDDGQVSSEHPNQHYDFSATTTMTSHPFRDRSNSEVFETPPTLTVYMGDVGSRRDLYQDSFRNEGENVYSTASNFTASTGEKLYPYDSTNSKMDDEHQYQVGNLAGINSAESTGAASVNAPPSTSTIYGPEQAAPWQRF